MPWVIFQRYFALYLCIINHNWAKLTTSVRCIKCGTCLPAILKSCSAAHPCDATHISRWLLLYIHVTLHSNSVIVALGTTAVQVCHLSFREHVASILRCEMADTNVLLKLWYQLIWPRVTTQKTITWCNSTSRDVMERELMCWILCQMP